MTDATIADTKASKGNPAASPVEEPKYEMPKLGSTDVPAGVEEIADKGIGKTKDAFKNAKITTEEAYNTAAKGATEYNLRVIEIARINFNAAFDYAHELLGVKSLSEFMELSSTRARKQFETMTAQAKELTALAQKVSIETAEPLKTGIARAFNKVA